MERRESGGASSPPDPARRMRPPPCPALRLIWWRISHCAALGLDTDRGMDGKHAVQRTPQLWRGPPPGRCARRREPRLPGASQRQPSQHHVDLEGIEQVLRLLAHQHLRAARREPGYRWAARPARGPAAASGAAALWLGGAEAGAPRAWLVADCPCASATSACCTRYLTMNSCLGGGCVGRRVKGARGGTALMH